MFVDIKKINLYTEALRRLGVPDRLIIPIDTWADKGGRMPKKKPSQKKKK